MAFTHRQWSLTLCSGVFVSCLVWHLNAWAAQTPLEVIRVATNQALAVLQDPTHRGDQNDHKRIERLWSTVLPYFDTQEIAQRALGIHWEELTQEQRQNFVRLFVQMVKKNYGRTLDRYTQDAQFSFDRERIEGDFAEVQVRLKTPLRGESFSLMYRLHREGDAWLIHDVVAENVSMVQNYRNQFNRIIGQSSYEGLVQAIEAKLNELESFSAS